MSRTLAQIEKDGYDTLTDDELQFLQQSGLLLRDALDNKWPREYGEAFDLLLMTYGWHLRLQMHPNDLIPFMQKGNLAVDDFFINKLRWASFRLRLQAIKRFRNRKKMINSAFKAHWKGGYLVSIPLFLMLSEGIFRELTGEDLFTKKQKSKMASAAKRKQGGRIPPIMTHIVDAASNGDIIGLRFSDNQYLKFPNVISRNKIMHGADYAYGTRINAYKALSQFEFVMESVYIAFTDANI